MWNDFYFHVYGNAFTKPESKNKVAFWKYSRKYA